MNKNRAAVVLKILHFGTMKAPKVEDRVQATAAATMGKKLVTQRYGANAKLKNFQVKL